MLKAPAVLLIESQLVLRCELQKQLSSTVMVKLFFATTWGGSFPGSVAGYISYIGAYTY
jgi:hypothetical protein